MVQGKQGLKEDPEVRCQVKTKDNPRVNQQADQEAKDQMVQGKQGLKEDPEVKCRQTKDNPRVKSAGRPEVKDQMVQDSQDTRTTVKVKAIKIIKEHRSEQIWFRSEQGQGQRPDGPRQPRPQGDYRGQGQYQSSANRPQGTARPDYQDVSSDSLVAHNNKMVGAETRISGGVRQGQGYQDNQRTPGQNRYGL